MDDLTSSNDDLLGIAESFYDAVTTPSAWPETWAKVGAHFGATSGVLFLDASDGIVPIAFPGFSDHALQLYAEHFNKSDRWTQVARQHKPERGRFHSFLGHHFVPTAEFEESEAWQDFSRHHVGAFHLVGSSFTMEDGTHAIAGLHRPRDAPAFAEGDERRMRLLLPHLRNALFLAQRLDAAENLANVGFAALEQLATGIAIVDSERRIVFANTALQRLAADAGFRLRPDDGAGLRGRRAQFSMVRTADQAQFVSLVQQATRLGAGGAMQPGLAADGRRLALFVMPLPSRLSPHVPGGGAFDSGKALVIVRDHANPLALRGDLLKALYSLTDAEVAVAQSLLGGRSPETVAAERGVSLPTIRTQVRHILDKAEVRSLRELEGMLMAL